jgi:hypothetical protein
MPGFDVDTPIKKPIKKNIRTKVAPMMMLSFDLCMIPENTLPYLTLSERVISENILPWYDESIHGTGKYIKGKIIICNIEKN